MTTALTTTTPNAMMAFGGNAFTDAGAEMGAREGSFLKFDGNTGDYTYGTKDNQEEMPHGTLLVANMMEAARGWICWKKGEVVDEVNVRVAEGKPPAESDLEDHGPYDEVGEDEVPDGWHEQSMLVFRTKDSGDLFTYKTTSASGKRAVGALLMAFGRQMARHPNALPVVEIGSTKFDSKTASGKKRGTKHAPSFEIAGWMSFDDFQSLADGADRAAEEATDPDAAPAGSEDASNYAPATSTTAAAAAPATGRRAKQF